MPSRPAVGYIVVSGKSSGTVGNDEFGPIAFLVRCLWQVHTLGSSSMQVESHDI